jgi:hypothetical protein
MSSISTPVLERFRAALGVLADAAPTLSEVRDLTDAQLLELNDLHTRGGRTLGSAGAVIAGELAYRSRPELGGDGLARRTGHRTVDNLLKVTTGATKEQVITVIAAGTLLTEIADAGTVDETTGEVQSPSQPWLRPVATALGEGRISTSASQSIARGLGTPNSAVTIADLEAAAVVLVSEAVAGVDADRLWRNARNLRDELDLAGVKIREDEARALRGLTHHRLPAGGGVATWRMDPETYARFVDFYDRATSPKRGGVRFIDPDTATKARKIAEDPRDYRQLASDTLLHFLMVGADTDPTVMIGSGAPIIRVTVPQPALATGVGFGRIDGQDQPISIDSVKRLMETGTTIQAGFDPTGHYIEHATDRLAENRLYNRKQREILAAKFGGCMDPDCDRPPSWCEAHHIQQVKRDGGKTTIANAILLCKYHHLLYHNHGYEITIHNDGTYWKIPPNPTDSDQPPTPTPTHMPLKTRNLHDLQAAQDRADAARTTAARATETRAAS